MVYNYFLSHIAIHGIGIDAYMLKFGGVGDVLEETLEEKMVNTLIANLGCPLCYKSPQGHPALRHAHEDGPQEEQPR